MSQSPPAPLRFPPVDGLTVRAEFDGGAMSSDVGPLIRRGVDPQIGLTTRLAEAIDDQRHPADITPPRRALIAQRIFQIGGGYKDGNDANARRTDPLFKLGLDRRPLGRAMDLASGPTFSRLENAVSTKEIDRMALALADGHTDVLFGLAGHRGLSPRAKPLLDANRQRQGVRDTNARRLNPPLPARPRSDHAWEYPAGTWPPAFRVILKAEGMTFDDTPPAASSPHWIGPRPRVSTAISIAPAVKTTIASRCSRTTWPAIAPPTTVSSLTTDACSWPAPRAAHPSAHPP